MGIPAFCTVNRTWIYAGLLLLLAGCATPPPQGKSTYDQINAELVNAAAGVKPKPAPPDMVGSALLPPLQIEMPKTGKLLEQKFNLVVNDAPAAQVFMGIVSDTRYSMLVHPGVTGTISANLKDVTVIEALDTLRELYGYEYKVVGTRIFIQPLGMQTRVFKVNYLMAGRSGNSSTTVTAGSSGSATGGAAGTGGSVASAAVSTNTAQDNRFWNDQRNAIRSIIGLPALPDTGAAPVAAAAPAVAVATTAAAVETVAALAALAAGTPSVVISPLSGLIVVRAQPRELHEVEKYLKSSQLIVERQVMLEAKILEVRLSEGYQDGINWASFASFNPLRNNRASIGQVTQDTTLRPLDANGAATALAGSAISATPGATLAGNAAGAVFGLAFQTSNFAALLNFLETQGGVSVLSSPRIATINNQKAVLKVGTDEVYITGFTYTPAVTSGTTTTPASTTPTSEMLFSGISLDVTPQIDEGGNVVLHVHPAVSTLSEVQKTFNLGTVSGNITLPLASRSVRETDSIVRVQDGNIVAIGGLMSQSQSSDKSGLPGTTSSSLGFLAGQRSSTSEKRELVILIKPTIIQDSDSWAPDVLQSQQRILALKREPKAINTERP